MADKPNNRNKNPEIDESVLDETIPNINEPQDPPEEPTDPPEEETVEEKEEVDEKDEAEVDAEADEENEAKPKPSKKDEGETDEQKEQRYKAQQTEAQIQAARNRALTEKVDEAAQIPDPTEAELRTFVGLDGVDWDELTTFEQSMAKKSFIAEKRFAVVNEAVQTSKKIDEWAEKVDTFIDDSDGKPEFLGLSGHEADFRKFSMQESHRGTPINILLGAFLHNLPAKTKQKSELFPTGSGGEKSEQPTNKIIDADAALKLRSVNPREWRRQIKLGNIKVEV